MESTKHFFLRIPFCVTRASVTFKSSLHQKIRKGYWEVFLLKMMVCMLVLGGISAKL